mmetsp:Transcript_20090/g.30426  ORF Transcript_20090/g.30426 Transcript_20090/m.30426 type:complete len:109 (+) Transcript_20090:442-768(+)
MWRERQHKITFTLFDIIPPCRNMVWSSICSMSTIHHTAVPAGVIGYLCRLLSKASSTITTHTVTMISITTIYCVERQIIKKLYDDNKNAAAGPFLSLLYFIHIFCSHH